MRPISFILNICCILFPCCFSAQTIKGKVVDGAGGTPLFSAVVGERGTTNGTTTDFDGDFSIVVKSLPATLVVSLVGFETLEVTVNAADKIVDIKIYSKENVLNEVNVVSDRILEKQKKSPLSVESMDAIAIKEVPTGSFYEGLAALKGVDMASASLAFRVINTRGFNSTSPVRVLQLIDGVDNQSPGLNFSLGNFLGAPDLDVKSVDVIQGASSAYYGPGAFNGVINMETKNPFLTPGLSVNLKMGERNLIEPSFRWADVFHNKKDEAFLAYKINALYLTANDWQANNYTPIYGSTNDTENPGRFDAVNIYGDEYFAANDYSTTSPASPQYRGLGTYYRTGYREEDLVDYNTENLKINAALHWRLKPEMDYESPELIAQFNMGKGTTVYQGDNRFSLRDIFFMQNRLEFRKANKYFIRAYATHENAGNSYDPYFTAQKLLESARSQEQWANVYRTYWQNDIIPRMNANGYPQPYLNPNWPGPIADPFYQQYILYDYAAQEQWMITYQDSLNLWHQQVEDWTNTGNAGLPIDEQGYFAPGSSRFKEEFNRITSLKNNEGEGGTKFYDRSALYNIQGEHKWSFVKLDELRVGFSGRLYTPDSDGSIFDDGKRMDVAVVDGRSDTTYTDRKITNTQYGFYVGVEKKLLEDRLNLNATARVDKNQNYEALFSPALSAVFSPKKNHFLRVSFSSALRNPTLADQFLNLNVGPATLRGNLNGVDRLITFASFMEWRDTQAPSSLVYFDIAPIKPEQARTIEVGYRATIFEKVFLDVSFYTTYYKNFIGFKIGIEAPTDSLGRISNFSQIKAYRYSANSDNNVITQGANAGANYYYYKQHALTFNYSFNKLAKANEDDPIIPAFNTPLHKFNAGLNGRDVLKTDNGNSWGYAVNYKWVDYYFWEGSPQFTGPVPAFTVVDAQINYTLKKASTNIKIGCSNLLKNEHIEAYGGPMIGRMAFISVLYEWSK
jgi:iron complex outermembrane receptor protein